MSHHIPAWLLFAFFQSWLLGLHSSKSDRDRYGELQDDYACGNQSVPLPSPSMFRPERMNATAWMESVKALGGKYAVLTVQTGCGFLLHHTKSTLPDGKLCTTCMLGRSDSIDRVDELVAWRSTVL